MRWSGAGNWVLLGSLLIFLLAAIGLAYEGTTIGGSFKMPVAGYIALALGVIFSLAVGVGLMALVFYSSRAGYDDPPQRYSNPGDAPGRELGNHEREPKRH